MPASLLAKRKDDGADDEKTNVKASKRAKKADNEGGRRTKKKSGKVEKKGGFRFGGIL